MNYPLSLCQQYEIQKLEQKALLEKHQQRDLVARARTAVPWMRVGANWLIQVGSSLQRCGHALETRHRPTANQWTATAQELHLSR